MRWTAAAVVGALALLLGSCGDADEGKDEAIQIAIGRLGDCLAEAGWDVDPDHVAEATSPAPADNTFRVSFQSTTDADEFLRLAVNYETREVLAYGDGDRTMLAAAGCAL